MASRAPIQKGPEKGSRKVRAADFALRLENACNSHPNVPEYGHGRQSYIQNALGLSAEGVRKWFSGEARPRPDAMRKLAALLEVDEAWLSLGISPEATPKQRKARNAEADGAVNILAGMIQMDGGHPSFPEEGELPSCADILAIIRGKSSLIHAALAERVGDGMYRFRIPQEHAPCTVVGMVRDEPQKFTLLHLPTAMLDRNQSRHGGHVEVEAFKLKGSYYAGQDLIHRIPGFTEKTWATK